jgi:mannonate dehydratase
VRIGGCNLNGREQAVAAYLTEHIAPLLIGRNPADIEDTWQYLYRGAYWRRGPVTMTAIGAIDVALWDLKGKTLGTPVYNLLGGRTRHRLQTYAHAWGTDLDQTIAAVGACLDRGYRAVRVQFAVPGMPEAYRPLESIRDATRPPEETWSTQEYLAYAPQVFARIRAEYGPEVALLHDAHQRLTLAEAGWLGRRLEEHNLFWLEDPIRGELQQSYRHIRQHTSTPLAVGETFTTVFDCTELVQNQLIDYLRMSTTHGGGISHLLKVAAFGDIFNIRIACHSPSDLSPISVAAALHLGLAIPNFAIHEHATYPQEVPQVFWSPPAFVDS